MLVWHFFFDIFISSFVVYEFRQCSCKRWLKKLSMTGSIIIESSTHSGIDDESYSSAYIYGFLFYVFLKFSRISSDLFFIEILQTSQNHHLQMSFQSGYQILGSLY